MRQWIAFTVLSASLLLGQQALAAKPQASQTLEKQAKKACLSGDYAKGVSLLADLFVDTGEATYLYNQGRCYEQNVRYVEAAERFKEYLRKAKNLSDADRAEVNQHIAECEASAAKGRSGEASPPPAPVAPAPAPLPAVPPPPLPAQPVPQAAGTAAVGTAPITEGRPWQHTAKWVAAGAAVAFLGLGVAEHVNYYGKNKDFNDNPTCVAGGCKSLADSADTAQTVAIVGYAAAAVATGLAVTFWLTDSPKAQASQHAGLGFTCTPALAGVSCSGKF